MLKRFSHFFFSTKVWLTSVIVTPLFLLLINPMMTRPGSLGNPLEVLMLMIFFGGALSIPNWIILVIASWQMSKKGKNIGQIKTTLTIVSVSLTLTLFFLLIVFTGFPVVWWTSLCYAFTIAVGIQFYPLKKEKPEIVWLENILDDNVF